MDLTSERETLATRLRGITDLRRVYTQAPEAIPEVPCAYLLPGEIVPSGFDAWDYRLSVQVLVSKAADAERGQAKLDALLALVVTAVHADPRASIVVPWQYGGFEHGGVSFLGARFDVEVLG